MATRAELGSLRAYVDPEALGRDAPASWRLIHLAHQLVDVYLSAARTRPLEVVAWAQGVEAPPGSPPWFAHTLAALDAASAGPAWARTRALDPGAPPPRLAGPTLHVVGVSAMSAVDRALLARFALHHPVVWSRPTLTPARWNRRAQRRLPEAARE